MFELQPLRLRHRLEMTQLPREPTRRDRTRREGTRRERTRRERTRREGTRRDRTSVAMPPATGDISKYE